METLFESVVCINFMSNGYLKRSPNPQLLDNVHILDSLLLIDVERKYLSSMFTLNVYLQLSLGSLTQSSIMVNIINITVRGVVTHFYILLWNDCMTTQSETHHTVYKLMSL